MKIRYTISLRLQNTNLAVIYYTHCTHEIYYKSCIFQKVISKKVFQKESFQKVIAHSKCHCKAYGQKLEIHCKK